MTPGRVRRIDQDHGRFRNIVKGTVQKDLSKYISGDRFITRKGDKKFSISIPYIDIPTFRYGKKQTGGVGAGDVEEGDILGREPGEGEEGAGSSGGDWIEEELVDVDLEELAEILGETLELPNIEPKGIRNVSADKARYTGISRSGPESLRHVKRTMKEALKRQMKADLYDFVKPRIIPIKEDKKYRSWEVKPAPELNAVIFYIMDVSGSMTDENKRLVRQLAFWIDLWLKHQYKDIDRRFIAHHDKAKEVDEEMFYKLRESGGTLPSTAFLIAEDLIMKHYPPDDWNIYWFYFSDGDVWNHDYETIWNILDRTIPRINLFAYAQTDLPQSIWGGWVSASMKLQVDQRYKDKENIITTVLNSKETILPTIKKFLGKGN
jgi:uncharacterized sporulation protein YeaH/YhbH (DUF444 family)